MVEEQAGEQRAGSGFRTALVKRPTNAPVAGSTSIAVKSRTWAPMGSFTSARKKYVSERKTSEGLSHFTPKS